MCEPLSSFPLLLGRRVALVSTQEVISAHAESSPPFREHTYLGARQMKTCPMEALPRDGLLAPRLPMPVGEQGNRSFTTGVPLFNPFDDFREWMVRAPFWTGITLQITAERRMLGSQRGVEKIEL